MNDSAGTALKTSFAQMFGTSIGGVKIDTTETPLFQRDYAQGRDSEPAKQVRNRFVSALYNALNNKDKPLHLDFIFGNAKDGAFYPVDGQQRLTTLFLLHCYLFWQQEGIHQFDSCSWHGKFHYATRPSARSFCDFLNRCRPPMPNMKSGKLSAWLCDQADYLPTWDHDPTIQGMLKMLDALHDFYVKHHQSQGQDWLSDAWERLLAGRAISFLLLPTENDSPDNTLYVRMNSRGRPLTPFENFKANFEDLLEKSQKDRAKEFSQKVDNEWSDLFFHLCKKDADKFDQAFMRYMHFVLDVCTWKHCADNELDTDSMKDIFTLSANLLDESTDSLEQIMSALDVWIEPSKDSIHRTPRDTEVFFSTIFTTKKETGTTTPLIAFNLPEENPNLLALCCEHYGTTKWNLSHTLLLHGVIQGIINRLLPTELHSRLRLLRNLLEASANEIRTPNMPELLGEVEAIMSNDAPEEILQKINKFNRKQKEDECEKAAFLATHPELRNTLYQLEDHELLRGALVAFDLDAAHFACRAEQFSALFSHPLPCISAALLAAGNDGRDIGRRGDYQYNYIGATNKYKSAPWRNYFRLFGREKEHPSASALMRLLDEMAKGRSLQTIIDDYLCSETTPKDWRYYITKYEAMRSEHLDFIGNYGISSSEEEYGIVIPKGNYCNSYYHYDAYLLALASCAGLNPEKHIANPGWPRCFNGSGPQARYLQLKTSGLKVRCVAAGWQWNAIGLHDKEKQASLAELFSRHETMLIPGSTSDWITKIARAEGVDTEDRIEKGAKLLRALLDQGL